MEADLVDASGACVEACQSRPRHTGSLDAAADVICDSQGMKEKATEDSGSSIDGRTAARTAGVFRQFCNGSLSSRVTGYCSSPHLDGVAVGLLPAGDEAVHVECQEAPDALLCRLLRHEPPGLYGILK